MTIATKAQLRTALGGADGFLHRSYTDARLDEIIAMAESRINRELRLIDMIATQTGTLSTAAATLALPARYMDKIQFRINDPLTELAYVDPSRIKEYAADLLAARMPKRYTVTDTIEFDAVPDSAYSYTLKYFQGYRLTADADTNYVLTTFPQAYLYACGIEHGVHTRDFELVQSLGQMLAGELASIKKAEMRRKGTADARLETEFFGRQTYNINQG